jgi:hypothetical protein
VAETLCNYPTASKAEALKEKPRVTSRPVEIPADDTEECIGTCGCRLSPLLYGLLLKALWGRGGAVDQKPSDILGERRSKLDTGCRFPVTRNPEREKGL